MIAIGILTACLGMSSALAQGGPKAAFTEAAAKKPLPSNEVLRTGRLALYWAINSSRADIVPILNLVKKLETQLIAGGVAEDLMEFYYDFSSHADAQRIATQLVSKNLPFQKSLQLWNLFFLATEIQDSALRNSLIEYILKYAPADSPVLPQATRVAQFFRLPVPDTAIPKRKSAERALDLEVWSSLTLNHNFKFAAKAIEQIQFSHAQFYSHNEKYYLFDTMLIALAERRYGDALQITNAALARYGQIPFTSKEYFLAGQAIAKFKLKQKVDKLGSMPANSTMPNERFRRLEEIYGGLANGSLASAKAAIARSQKEIDSHSIHGTFMQAAANAL